MQNFFFFFKSQQGDHKCAFGGGGSEDHFFWDPSLIDFEVNVKKILQQAGIHSALISGFRSFIIYLLFICIVLICCYIIGIY